MFILLTIACSLYFVLGEISEGMFDGGRHGNSNGNFSLPGSKKLHGTRSLKAIDRTQGHR
jgi:hypothetical protein